MLSKGKEFSGTGDFPSGVTGSFALKVQNWPALAGNALEWYVMSRLAARWL